ncbi:MAG TPA: DUF116 domain-containing protein [Anaerolineales bacterium]|nr:DUF116 domain-containing protein [Anaerolineales bacterium]
MVKIITYTLKNNHENSDCFYTNLAAFTDRVLQQADGQVGDVLDDFQLWLTESQAEPARTRPEYIFDLLTIGILWVVYGREAATSPGYSKALLTRLVAWRKQFPLLKPGIDFIRGLLGGLTIHSIHTGGQPGLLTTANISTLVKWLTASGEYGEEARRLKIWVRFFAEQENPEPGLQSITDFAGWFETASLTALGDYTPKVETFLANRPMKYRWREDFIFTGRRRVEYHMYMLGMEIMNRSFRAQFLNAEQKILFVPPCMADPENGSCQAVDTPYGARCAHCTPSCQVNQITKYGKKYDIPVYMIPDSFSPLSEGGGKLGDKSLGVVGVSCPVTITGGGFEMRRAGILAQGVLLDHCGCSWHWDLGGGTVTEINFRQLIRTLGQEAKPRSSENK